MSTAQPRDPADANVAMQEVAINAYRTEGAMVLVAPMPGVMPDDVEITVDGPTISLRAELRSDAPKDYVIHEWDYGAYERTVDIGDGYGGDVTATLGKGQLVVSISAGDGRSDGPVVVHPGGPDQL
ncbi:MAG: Hsp20/alpha crystallin family protein [Acidimicrobiia bacterium]|nr:Hsp20/alpha crystallin family protein [Acidimicrobiia bacterium]